MAKSSGAPLLLVGHVTKDGDLAGPRAVEHLVDTVLSFDGDRHHALRVLTSVKHRFGPAGEVGIFEMRDDGLRAVPDPGPLLLGDRMADVPGSVVVPVLQGRRPLLVEVQALLGPGTGGGRGRRGRRPWGSTPRGRPLLAVLACRTAVEMPASAEMFAAAVGGITVTEPAADLAVALAMASVVTDVPSRPTSSSSGSSVSPARCVPSPARTGAWPRRTGPASPGRWCPRPWRAHRLRHRRAGRHGVRTLAEALGLARSEVGARDGPGTMPGWPTVPAAASL